MHRSLVDIEAVLGPAWARQIQKEADESARPEACLLAFDRVRHALVGLDPTQMGPPLARLWESSDFLPALVGSRPGLLKWLAGSRFLDQPKPLARLSAEACAAVSQVSHQDEAAFYQALRRYKYRELFRIAYRDAALGAPMRGLGLECSNLAQALISAAHGWISEQLQRRFGKPRPDGFCVLGMGKLGGEDLNFSSDVDLIYLYRGEGDTEGGPDGCLSNIQYFTKLAEALTRAISSKTQEGFCFRVDLNLRPHGRSGPVVLSLPAATAYYESFGRTWERAALIKARCIAGDFELADEFLKEVEPFIWRRSADLSVVEGLRDLKAQINLSGKNNADDVKLGPGGIREVEFFVNALQLLYGGRQPGLRDRNTLRALRKLQLSGILSAQDADGLEEAYFFLRRVENRLQMLDERQVHALPTSEGERLRLARSLGFPSIPAFEQVLSRHRSLVKDAFDTLLGQTARGEGPQEASLALALDPDATWGDREQALRARGFLEPDRALRFLERLGRLPESPFAFGSASGLRLLSELARTADPDQALTYFSEFIRQLRAPTGYWNLLANIPQASRRILNLFGQSEYLSRYFLGHPQLLDSLVQGLEEQAYKPPQRLRADFSSRVREVTEFEERLGMMRRVRNEEVLRIGMHDIAGAVSIPEVTEQLTALAEAALTECLELAEAEQTQRYGLPVSGDERQKLVVLGMGKLGGRELGYHSDLDLLFVYSGQGQDETAGGRRGKATHHEYFANWVQRMLSYLQLRLGEGYLYQTDTRLRPSGNQGALVVSQRAFLEHHEKRAQLWERQALIKARAVAGDLSLFEPIQKTVHALVYERPLPVNTSDEIDRLRDRMEREVAGETDAQLNAKLGAGGLVEVEFAVQYLQLVHGKQYPSVRTPNTLEALDALETRGCLSPADIRALRGGYLFLRRVENRLRLMQGHSLSHLPTEGRPLTLLARSLGYFGNAPGPEFLSEYREQTGRIRTVYTRLMRTADGHT